MRKSSFYFSAPPLSASALSLVTKRLAYKAISFRLPRDWLVQCFANTWTEKPRISTGVDFGEARERCSLGSNTEGGDVCLGLSVFWQVIPIWQQEIQNSGLR